MAVRDLADYFDDGLDYPGVPSKKHPEGKTYRIPSPDAKTGLWLTQLAHVGSAAAFGGNVTPGDLARLQLDDAAEMDLYQKVMGCTDQCRPVADDGTVGEPCGSVYDQMIDDGVPWTVLQKIGQDAYLYFAVDQAFADTRLAGQGKATTEPNRSEKRATAKAGQKSGRASGGTATQTRRRASSASSNRTGSGKAKAKAG